MTRQAKFALLGGLYVSQGLPYGFFTQAVPALLRQQGVSNALVGLSALLMLPWGLKFLWAPLVDRTGTRRSWIIPLQAAGVAVLAGLAFVNPTGEMPWVLLGLLIINLISATQDIATDGLAVEMLAPSERGMGNALQVGAYRLGMIVGGGVLLIFLDVLGWRTAFLLMAALLALASIPIVRHREPVRPRPPPSLSMWTATGHWLRQSGAARWALVLVLYKGFDAMGSAMVKSLLIDLKYDLGDIGAMVGAVGSITALVGALLGGICVHRLGRRRALLGFGLAQALAVGAYALPAMGWSSPAWVYAVVSLDSLVGSAATTVLFTLMMDACRADQTGTDYTIQASVVVLAVGGTSALSGVLCDALGYTGHFFAVAGLTALGVLAVAALLRQPTLAFPHSRTSEGL
jgi:MFS transporter, PAT family, beta-lactamase induction signal transducer AmpG